MEATEVTIPKEAIKPLSDVEKLTQTSELAVAVADKCWLRTPCYSCCTHCPQAFTPPDTKTALFRSGS